MDRGTTGSASVAMRRESATEDAGHCNVARAHEVEAQACARARGTGGARSEARALRRGGAL